MIYIYLGSAKPYISKLCNYIEIFNELTIMCAAYHLFLLTDFMPDVEK